MESPLFSLNDIILILIVFESLILLALVLSITLGKPQRHRAWLAALLIAFAVDTTATLLYWTPPISALLGDWAAPLYLFLRLGLIAQGPLLFIYLRRFLGLSNQPTQDVQRYLLPNLLIGGLLAGATLSSLGIGQIRAAASDYAVLWLEPIYKLYLVWQVACLALFTLLSWRAYQAFKTQMKEQLSSIEDLDENWVRLLILGFLLMCLCYLAAGVANYFEAIRVDHWFNVIGHYLDFLFINALIFYSLAHTPRRPLNDNRASLPGLEIRPDQILAHLQRSEPYLDPNYTLQQLADDLGISAKALSQLINQQMQMNFFELVNGQRVEHAQRLLINKPSLPVIDVMMASGFQTKSAFNRVFKQFSKTTPSAYRVQNLK